MKKIVVGNVDIEVLALTPFVYSQGKGEKVLRIEIEEAKANLEAEKLNAQAEIERAKGAAEAIRIENGSLTSTYIQYLWVRQQNNIPDKVVYIPTEANLPILEAKK